MTAHLARARRQAAHRLGHRAEWLALGALMLRGYRPVARRVSLAGGEIDLIVRRGRTLVFVEVKARARLGEARTAIGAVKRQRFSRAVRAWIGRHPWSANLTLRADAVFVGGRGWPEHCPAAFEIERL
ncbi:YraN family protein [Methylobacterium sp. J-076]|uniref:YraN family protein n=1 Tax=Methylobacterium sp. J-076 TaxID=2836655 RepID=UPI001FB9A184|nr:YraN family protein [Methylobacterium sp. J-076]MCJ2013952.1 YraN family protein [Methylobacterium sp. J-076]